MSGGRHGTNEYLVGATIRTMDINDNTVVRSATPAEMTKNFIFSRFVNEEFVGTRNSDELIAQLAVAMTHHNGKKGELDPTMPAGYTYLGQFIDHDLTLDDRELDLRALPIDRMPNKRSPTLDLDSLYGEGPTSEMSKEFYQADGASLIEGSPLRDVPGDIVVEDGTGYDLPRRGKPGEFTNDPNAKRAKIPDVRNDENLAVAQIHAAMIRFHNKVVKQLVGTVPQEELFERTREVVAKHYQWMIWFDYLPRIVSPKVLDDVFTNGRKVFEKDSPNELGTMPVEFSGAAFRLGHSMIREAYEWNKNFGTVGNPIDSGHIFRLFRFSGTSGTLQPSAHPAGSEADIKDLDNPQPPFSTQLPGNWVADWLRMFDFSRFASTNITFKPADAVINHASKIDTHLVDPLATLPLGSVNATPQNILLKKRNLAFRNLARGRMLGLPSGQQMVQALNAKGCAIKPLNEEQLLNGRGGGVSLNITDVPQRDELKGNAPLWFYILREAEFNKNKLDGVGARIVAETMHRALQGSRYSILKDNSFKPTLGPGTANNRFNMEDLLHFAFNGDPKLLSPF